MVLPGVVDPGVVVPAGDVESVVVEEVVAVDVGVDLRNPGERAVVSDGAVPELPVAGVVVAAPAAVVGVEPDGAVVVVDCRGAVVGPPPVTGVVLAGVGVVLASVSGPDEHWITGWRDTSPVTCVSWIARS